MRVAALASVVLVCLGLSALARGGTVHPTFHPRWQVVSRGGVGSDGAYTMLWSGRSGVVGTLINELSGQRRRVAMPSGCPDPVGGQDILGDTWLLVPCPHYSMELYSLATGQWATQSSPAVCRHKVGKGPTCTPAAVGTNWIKYDENSVHLGDRWLFQNIVTGAVRSDPTNAHTLPDLDSPLLTEAVCPPLRVPSDKTQNTLELDGRYAVLSNRSGIFLEHCATHLRRLLTDHALGVTVGPDEIMWMPRPNRPLEGVFLPSRRRFSVAVPRGAEIEFLVIGARHLYVLGQAGRGNTLAGVGVVWSAPLPASLAASRGS